MDPKMRLILANAPRAENWEDREGATNDVKTLMEEFEKRLPSRKAEQEGPQPEDSQPTQD